MSKHWFSLRAVLTVWLWALSTLALAMGETSGGKVLDVSAENLLRKLEQSKGRIILQTTSRDPNCGFCVRANPTYEALARAKPEAGRYWRVSFQPWDAAFIDPLMIKFRANGVPGVFVFEDGALVNYVPGDWPLAELQTKVLGGRNGPQVPQYGLDIHDVDSAYIEEMIQRRERFVVLFTADDPASCRHCAAGEKAMAKAWEQAKGKWREVVVKRVTFSNLEHAKADPLSRRLKLEGLPAMVCFMRTIASNETESAVGVRFIGAAPGSGFFDCSSSPFTHLDYQKRYTRLDLPN
jgi:hypothetical protein